MTRLIDTHQHLIYPDAAGYSWTDSIAPLANRSFTLAQTQRLSLIIVEFLASQAARWTHGVRI